MDFNFIILTGLNGLNERSVLEAFPQDEDREKLLSPNSCQWKRPRVRLPFKIRTRAALGQSIYQNLLSCSEQDSKSGVPIFGQNSLYRASHATLTQPTSRGKITEITIGSTEYSARYLIAAAASK